MFFLGRLLMGNTNPTLRWGIAGALLALGVGLIIWGLLDKQPVIIFRGVIELVLVAVLVLRFRSLARRRPAGLE